MERGVQTECSDATRGEESCRSENLRETTDSAEKGTNVWVCFTFLSNATGLIAFVIYSDLLVNPFANGDIV